MEGEAFGVLSLQSRQGDLSDCTDIFGFQIRLGWALVSQTAIGLLRMTGFHTRMGFALVDRTLVLQNLLR